MTQNRGRSKSLGWLGQAAEAPDPFGGGKLWIGEHVGDQDILVLDPAEADPTAEVLDLYSLAQHRTRRFARAIALERIRPLADELARARAKKVYAQRVALRDAHQRALDAAQTERMEHMREALVAAHQRFVENLGLSYQGVHKTSSDIRSARVARCHACGIDLDNFVGASCAICSGVLCSCGACACGKPARVRRPAARAASDVQRST